MSNIAILVPAYNEELVISSTLKSLLQVAPAEDIYVVSDGSTDNTVEIALGLGVRVGITNHLGKAGSSNMAIKNFKLIDRYKYILPMDADTLLSPDFLEQTLPIFEKDMDESIIAVVGKVVGKGNNWVTSYRLWEYEVAQTIHKSAQSIENAIIVCPGCATIYRIGFFADTQIPSETLAEDMDLTFLLHRNHLGRIVYCSKAEVYTQDPNTLKDLLKQIDRWYTGFWQCIIKHNIPWGGQPLDAEVALLATEGLFNGLLVILLIFLIPYTIVHRPALLIVPILVDFFLFMLPTIIYTAINNKSYKIITYIFHFYLIRILSCLIFMKSFVKIIFGLDLITGWNKATRYQAI